MDPTKGYGSALRVIQLKVVGSSPTWPGPVSATRSGYNSAEESDRHEQGRNTMKLGLIFATGAMLAALSVGCAANPAMQSQLEGLQRESNRQDAEIKDLSAKAAKCNGQL